MSRHGKHKPGYYWRTRERRREVNREYSERNREKLRKRREEFIKKHPGYDHAHYLAHKFPLESLCELCPEDDKRKATERHLLDIRLQTENRDIPLFISVCPSCHRWLEGHGKYLKRTE